MAGFPSQTRISTWKCGQIDQSQTSNFGHTLLPLPVKNVIIVKFLRREYKHTEKCTSKSDT